MEATQACVLREKQQRAIDALREQSKKMSEIVQASQTNPRQWAWFDFNEPVEGIVKKITCPCDACDPIRKAMRVRSCAVPHFQRQVRYLCSQLTPSGSRRDSEVQALRLRVELVSYGLSNLERLQSEPMSTAHSTLSEPSSPMANLKKRSRQDAPGEDDEEMGRSNKRVKLDACQPSPKADSKKRSRQDTPDDDDEEMDRSVKRVKIDSCQPSSPQSLPATSETQGDHGDSDNDDNDDEDWSDLDEFLDECLEDSKPCNWDYYPLAVPTHTAMVRSLETAFEAVFLLSLEHDVHFDRQLFEELEREESSADD